MIEILAKTLGMRFLEEVFHTEGKFSISKIIGGFLGSLTSAKIEDWTLEKLDQIGKDSKTKSFPVTQSLEDATYLSLVLAGTEVGKCCLRNFTLDAVELKKTRSIVDFLSEQIRLIATSRATVSAEEIVIKNISLWENGIISDDLLSYEVFDENTLSSGLVYKIKSHLFGKYQSEELPAQFARLLHEGWNEQGQQYSFTTFACGYFKHMFEHSEPLKHLLQKQWFQIITNEANKFRKASDSFLELLNKVDKHVVENSGILQSISKFVNPQPILRFNYSNRQREKKTLFRTRYVPFCGREEEVNKAVEFFRSKPLFDWWVITGPGGIGKSRLAMELCYELHYLFTLNAGFIERDHFTTFNWDTWQPNTNTFIIIDYASTCYEYLAKVFRKLANREDLRFRVRILLVERELHGEWWEDLLKGINMEDIPKPWQRPHRLYPINEAFLWSIFEFTLQDHGKSLPDRDLTLHNFYKIDEKQRPLFALFYALAIAEGKAEKIGSKTDLLESYLERTEEKIWKPMFRDNALLTQYKILVAYATVCGGFSDQQLRDILQQKHQWLPTNVRQDLYQSIAGFESEKTHPYRPLEPDILGEFFALKVIKVQSTTVSLTPQFGPILIAECWQKFLFESLFFTVRIYQDFSDEDTKSAFLSVLEQSDSEVDLRWCLALYVQILQIHFDNKNYANALDLYTKLVKLETFRLKKELQIRQAQASALVVQHVTPESTDTFIDFFELTYKMSLKNKDRQVLLTFLKMINDLIPRSKTTLGIHIGDVERIERVTTDREVLSKVTESYRLIFFKLFFEKPQAAAFYYERIRSVAQNSMVQGCYTDLLLVHYTLLMDNNDTIPTLLDDYTEASATIRTWTDQNDLFGAFYSIIDLLEVIPRYSASSNGFYKKFIPIVLDRENISFVSQSLRASLMKSQHGVALLLMVSDLISIAGNKGSNSIWIADLITAVSDFSQEFINKRSLDLANCLIKNFDEISNDNDPAVIALAKTRLTLGLIKIGHYRADGAETYLINSGVSQALKENDEVLLLSYLEAAQEIFTLSAVSHRKMLLDLMSVPTEHITPVVFNSLFELVQKAFTAFIEFSIPLSRWDRKPARPRYAGKMQQELFMIFYEFLELIALDYELDVDAVLKLIGKGFAPIGLAQSSSSPAILLFKRLTMLINLSKDDSVRNDLLIIAENTLQAVADPEKRNFEISIELEKWIAELTTLTAMK